jgi:TonB-linked SusC/RagA family outer membrane protein
MKKTEPFSESFYHSLKKTYLIMRIATLLMILGILQTYAADSYAQKTRLSLDYKDTELIKVLDNIENESEFFFLYNEKLINTGLKVSITANNELINKILDKLFDATDIKYTIIDRKIILAPEYLTDKIIETQPQQQIVTGTITDAATGEVLPGVNIQIKGTMQGTISDVSGKFSINVPNKDAVLLFSFVGFIPQEITIANQTSINVALNSQTTGLEEVVVIGYGTQKKETLTGSITQVKGTQLQATKSPSAASSIQGKVAGVLIRQQSGEPGTFNSLINVRGFGTPLLVIDGVVRDGMSDFEKLNSMDIESISVLKDASSAIYGMNASNGVIIVTTKSGFKGKTVFSYSAMLTYKQPTTRNLQKSVDAYNLRLLNNEMLRNSKLPLATSDADLEKWKQGTVPGYTDYNWYNECLRNFTSTQQHNFSAQGGNENISFFTSFGYMNDVGILKINDLEMYNKYNLRTNLTAKLAKGLTAKISFSGRYEDTKQPPIAYYYLFKRIIVSDRGYGAYSLVNPKHLANVPPMNSNAWAEMMQETAGYNRTIGFQYQTTLDVNYQIPFIKGLSLGIVMGYDGNNNNNRFLDKSPQLYDYYTDAPNSTALPTYRESVSLYTRGVIQSKISYTTTIGQSHNISATLVNEIRRTGNNNLTGKRQYDDVYTHDIIDQGSLTNQSTTGNRTEEAYLSYLGRFNYDYKSKYLFEFSFREDGSYRYAPSQRWVFFPAVSAGWRISREDFIKNIFPIISDMKLRGSWGQSGQDAGSPFQYSEGYSFGSVSGGYVMNENTLTLGMVAPGLVNQNLSWVSTTTSDIGLDLELWKGKLGFTWDLYWRNSNGELATRTSSVPNTFGASFPQENLNSSQIKGFEITLSHRNNIGKINYSIDANVTVARRYRLHVEQSPYRSTLDEWKSGSDGNGRIQGKDWLYQEAGQYTDITQYEEKAPLYGSTNGNSYRLPGMSVIVDVNGDGVINSNDQLPTGWVGVGNNPPLQYGSNWHVSYKNFDIDMGLQGASFFNVQVARDDNWGYGTRFPVFWTKYLDRWRTEDPTANPYDPATKWIPGRWEALTATTTGNLTSAASDRWHMDATYLRIKTLELGYSVPVNISRKISIDNLRIYMNCFNLYTFCQKDVQGLDPERNESDNNGTYTVDLTYPLMRAFNFGVEIKF